MKGLLTLLREKFASPALPVKSVLSPQSTGNNVLVVDDDTAVCRILHRMLSDEQYTVETSRSVADALAAIEEKPYDVYVIDYKLSDGSGFDIAERIRSKCVKLRSLLFRVMTRVPWR
jgi:DNA-binding NtrC family response regulator